MVTLLCASADRVRYVGEYNIASLITLFKNVRVDNTIYYLDRYFNLSINVLVHFCFQNCKTKIVIWTPVNKLTKDNLVLIRLGHIG